MIRIPDIEKVYCPFWESRKLNCRVSFSREAVGTKRCLNYCMSDDHDNCPLYLAEALRRSRIITTPIEPSHFILR